MWVSRGTPSKPGANWAPIANTYSLHVSAPWSVDYAAYNLNKLSPEAPLLQQLYPGGRVQFNPFLQDVPEGACPHVVDVQDLLEGLVEELPDGGDACALERIVSPVVQPEGLDGHMGVDDAFHLFSFVTQSSVTVRNTSCNVL